MAERENAKNHFESMEIQNESIEILDSDEENENECKILDEQQQQQKRKDGEQLAEPSSSQLTGMQENIPVEMETVNENKVDQIIADNFDHHANNNERNEAIDGGKYFFNLHRK